MEHNKHTKALSLHKMNAEVHAMNEQAIAHHTICASTKRFYYEDFMEMKRHKKKYE